MKDLNQIIESLREPMTETLANWIKIPSVKGDAAPGAPFGVEVRKALDLALEDAATMGFEVRNFDGYAGDVRMGPLGVDPIAILAHLDVVPVGDGWQQDPFGAEIIDGNMYGRGTSDDKGPAVAALYAMYACKLAEVPLNREVRLILGCDEESGWGCMDYYAKHCDMPRVGFSPDANFPVINTEKGMLGIRLSGAYAADGLKVKEINVGERTNVIPGLATALVEGDETLCAQVAAAAEKLNLDVKAEAENGLVKILSTGIPGHAAFPEPARNAIGQLLLALKELGATGALEKLSNCVGMEYDGKGLEIKCQDEVSGALTCNLGILRYNEQDGLFATLDIRHPILCDQSALANSLTAALAPEVTATVSSKKAPHHVAPNSKLVTALMSAYAEVTGDTVSQPMAIGGGTYAKCLEEGVAFGSLFPHEEELAHQAGEYINLQSLLNNLAIFVKAIENLQ